MRKSETKKDIGEVDIPFHIGTYCMGREENAVVNGELKVTGIEALRVVGASVIPDYGEWEYQCDCGDDRRKSDRFNQERKLPAIKAIAGSKLIELHL